MAFEHEELGDIWKQILSPIKKVGGTIERKIIRPTIGAQGIGKPLSVAAKQIEIKIIRPTLGRAIKPIAAVMPKITIGGHRYDLGGHQVLQKTVTGAVAGAATYAWSGPGGWVYGAIAGGLAANLQHGKPNVLQDLTIGAVAGATAGYAAGLSPAEKLVTGTIASSAERSAGSVADYGNTAAEGYEVFDNSGKVIGTVNEYGYAVDDAGNVLGQVDEYGNLVSSSGDAIGTVGAGLDTGSSLVNSAGGASEAVKVPGAGNGNGITAGDVQSAAGAVGGAIKEGVKIDQMLNPDGTKRKTPTGTDNAGILGLPMPVLIGGLVVASAIGYFALRESKKEKK